MPSKHCMPGTKPHSHIRMRAGINPSSLKHFSQTHLAKRPREGGGGIFGPLPKIFVMRGPIDLTFGMNVKGTSNFHLIVIT